MTRDYAKPSTTRKKTPVRKKPARATGKTRKGAAPPPPPPPKRWKLLAILLALVAGFGAGIYSLTRIPATQAPETPKKSTQSGTKTGVKTTPKTLPEQRFKFYDLLEESEVIAPKVDTYTFKEKNKDNDFYYMVQTGSFRSSVDAERQKATIAFQGLKASIKPVQNDQGTLWYRVMTGPFYSRTEMNSALDKLVAINIEPLVKKVKK
ncbi:MAG: sporulation protein [Oleiphilus sp.]|nr:MAG: sporulation protein [Oleiphilus sp.]